MKTKGKQGFASMTPERLHAVAVIGGKAVQAQGKGHKFTKTTARIAGQKGGSVPRLKRKKNRTQG